jgi:acyl-CoA reductase-like NAD-dependent aldehyde dehydrogenase
VTEPVPRLRVGDGLAPDTAIRPLINRAGFDMVAEHAREALRQEAQRMVSGGLTLPIT